MDLMMEREKAHDDYCHPLLQSRPNFSRALEEFRTFLSITLEDMTTKLQSLVAQRKIVKKRKVKNYIACQIFMLRKHIHRLNQFEAEIKERLDTILHGNEELARIRNLATARTRKKSSFQAEVEEEPMAMEAFDEPDGSIGGRRNIAKEEFSPVTREADIVSEGGLTLNLKGSEPKEMDEVKVAMSISTQSSDSKELNSLGDDQEDLDAIISAADEYLTMVASAQERDDGEEPLSSIGGASLSGSNASNASNASIDGGSSSCCGSGDNNNVVMHGLKSTPSDEACSGRTGMPANHPKDLLLLQLLADMNKMKRRCKHIMDVTDKYCVVNNYIDLNLDCKSNEVEELNQALSKSPSSSPWSSRCSSACSNTPPSLQTIPTPGPEAEGPHGLPLQLPTSISDKGIVRITLESISNHLSVIVKTYTSKNQSSGLTSAGTQPKS